MPPKPGPPQQWLLLPTWELENKKGVFTHQYSLYKELGYAYHGRNEWISDRLMISMFIIATYGKILTPKQQ